MSMVITVTIDAEQYHLHLTPTGEPASHVDWSVARQSGWFSA